MARDKEYFKKRVETGKEERAFLRQLYRFSYLWGDEFVGKLASELLDVSDRLEEEEKELEGIETE